MYMPIVFTSHLCVYRPTKPCLMTRNVNNVAVKVLELCNMPGADLRILRRGCVFWAGILQFRGLGV